MARLTLPQLLDTFEKLVGWIADEEKNLERLKKELEECKSEIRRRSSGRRTPAVLAGLEKARAVRWKKTRKKPGPKPGSKRKKKKKKKKSYRLSAKALSP